MAKRRNEFLKLAEKIEAGFLAPLILGAARSAQGVVRELQEIGPAWSGAFSNSWQIASASKVSSGNGSFGRPQRLLAPILTPNEYKFKPEVKYRITNTAPYADVALDLVESNYIYPGFEPLKKAERGNRISGVRGNLSLTDAGPNRRTAPLDWYTTYIRGGGIDKRISLYVNEAMRNIKL